MWTQESTEAGPGVATAFAMRVTEVRDEAAGVRSFRLARTDGEPLPHWEPGAHIDVTVADGTERQYSLCGDPAGDTWQIAVLREEGGRGGSRHLHDNVRAGSALRVRGPRNHFPLVTAPGYLFIAGGIGITPLRPMIERVRASGVPWRLVYGGRTREGMAFAAELAALGPQAVLRPEAEHGLLPVAEEIERAGPEVAVYCCGPEPLLSAVESACRGLGRPEPHVERFTALPLDDSETAAFEIELAGTGEVFLVGPDVSIMDVLEENGHPVDSSCQEGICGTCETGVLRGTPIHRDSVLTAADHARGDCMMVCVSRAAAGERLVLDR
ncbi:MAG TPA: PDR/VanB family oxidoreductase [Amycolatopsis sp.]|nr:PDR/VanB family oxidoreductase [Amycolatopsis sp.]